MAGNPVYIIYTVLMIFGIVVIGVISFLDNSKRLTRKLFYIAIPLVILSQFYFWNMDFNHYVKSFLFPSKAYECTYYGNEKVNITFPLPKRTVFLGIEDVCSPFYFTYINDRDFISFYRAKLEIVKNNGEIKGYQYTEHTDQYMSEYKGFVVELLSSTKVDIFIKRYEESDQRYIDIDYKPNN